MAAFADDVAYNNHNFDDGLRAGLFDLDEVAGLPVIGDLLAEVRQKYPNLDRQRTIYETIRRMVGVMVYDLTNQIRRRINASGTEGADDIRGLSWSVAEFSPGMTGDLNVLRHFLMRRMYCHYKVNRMTIKAKRIVAELFDAFAEEPSILPTEWYEATGGRGAKRHFAPILPA